MAPQSAFQQLHTSFSDALHSGFQQDTSDCSALRTHFAASRLADSERRTVVEHCFREHLFAHIIGNGGDGGDGGDGGSGDLSRIGRFCDYAIAAGRQQMATAALPVILVADVFDVLTLDQCELVFAYVEDNVGVWREDWMFAASKNILLRMCNDLLRRLSRSQNTVFCGRILLFLAKFFPFSERSGLNVVSEFNLENLTEFERVAATEAATAGEVAEVTAEAGSGEAAEAAVAVRLDHSLYCKFWALQDFFRNPNQCYQRTQWETFAAHATSVLAAFTSFKLEEPRPSGDDADQQPLNAASASAAAAMDIDADGLEASVRETQHFFAKFLTNPKLLALQLSDANFRRSVLVQFLILFQYLRSTVKFKADTFTLTAVQSEYIAATDTTIYRLLGETPPNGPQFAATVRHMLQREEMWNNWKNDGCREFSRPAAAVAAAADEVAPVAAAAPAASGAAAPAAAGAAPTKPAAKRRAAAAAAADDRLLGDLVQDSLNAKRFYMGCPELTRLWNICPDNLQACRGEDRNFLPSIETYLENPKDKTDPSFEWRALRLLARQSPHFFSLTQTPNKVSDYLEGVRKKIHESKSKATVAVAVAVGSAAATVPPTTAATATAAAAIAIKAELLSPPTGAGGAGSEMAVDVETATTAETDATGDSQDGSGGQALEDDHNAHRIAVVTPEQKSLVATIIGAAWRKVGAKMGYTPDVLKFIDDKPGKTVPEKCLDMLSIWFEEDEDASLDNLAYMLEGLELVVAAEAIKRILEPADKMEDISE